MIELVDTHAHLNFIDFDKNLKSVLTRAKAAGISKIVVPSSELISARKALEISTQFKNVFAAVGIHPLYVIGAGGLFVEDGSPQGFYTKSGGKPTSVFYLKEFEEMLGSKYVVAIGEIGLDYYESPHRENPVNRELQLEVLQKNFELAIKYNKPAIVHLRTSKNSSDAFEDFLGVANKFSDKLKAVIHCYSGDLKIAKKIIDAGFYISFTNLTFYNLAIQNTFKKIDLSRVMLETDSPFLSPNNTR
ncbi:MAG: TatD family hydrolase, partial [Patescibacteria group bacterium]|nr:TatD family hydrolase [Patescibacteria group bacterium]